MAIQNWSEKILLVDLADDPSFTEDLNTLLENVTQNKGQDVALNFAGCTFVNSSNLAKLLKLRKTLMGNNRKLVLCGINNHVWGVFLVTGLDKIFTFANDIATGLAKLQL
jgi:anti-anti-sigma factor